MDSEYITAHDRGGPGWRWLMLLGVCLLAILVLAGCGGTARAVQSFVEIHEAAVAQSRGAPMGPTSDAIRGHALVGLMNLGYEPQSEDLEWLKQHLPPK